MKVLPVLLLFSCVVLYASQTDALTDALNQDLEEVAKWHCDQHGGPNRIEEAHFLGVGDLVERYKIVCNDRSIIVYPSI